MTKANSACGKFNALTLKTRLTEMQAEDANFKIAYSEGIAVLTVQLPITEKQYARTVKDIEPERVTNMFNLMDSIGDFVSPNDIGASMEDVAALGAGAAPATMSDWMHAAGAGAAPATMSDWMHAAGAGRHPTPGAGPEPTEIEISDADLFGAEQTGDEVLELDAEELPAHGVDEVGADISIDPTLGAGSEPAERQLAVGDKVAILTDTSITFMVLAVGPEHAGLACLRDGMINLICAPVQMLGFVGDAPGAAT